MAFSKDVKDVALKQIKELGYVSYSRKEWPNGKPVFEELAKEGKVIKAWDCCYKAV